MKSKPNFDILESLRGLAALYVCIGHARANLWIGGDQYLKLHPQESQGITDYLILVLNILTRLSSEFVIVFFVLSGFSIAHSLRKNTQVLHFYKRRFIRLYPPYISALLWAMVVILIINQIAPQFINGTYQTATFDRLNASTQLFEWDAFLKNLIYLPQLDGVLTPFWSLTMEVIFYLLAPFVFRNRKMFYNGSILLFLFWIVNKFAGWPVHPVLEGYLFYNLFFAIGVALYFNYDFVIEKFKFLTTSKALWFSIALFFSMIGISLVIRKFESITAFLAAMMAIALIAYLLTNKKEIKWLIGIGRFSYTLYITHFPTIMLYLVAFFLITNAQPPYIYNSLVFIPCVFFCLGIAYLHYYFIERKSKQMLEGLRKRGGIAKEHAPQLAKITESGAE